MKRVFAAVLLVIGLTTQAQERPQGPQGGPHPEMEKLTPAQRRDLHVKEMTLKLDLNNSQQKEMSKVLEDADSNREKMKAQFEADKGKELTGDEIYARKSSMLDNRIAMKQRVKKILNDEQYKKWEQEKKLHKKHGKKHGKHGKGHRKGNIPKK